MHSRTPSARLYHDPARDDDPSHHVVSRGGLPMERRCCRGLVPVGPDLRPGPYAPFQRQVLERRDYYSGLVWKPAEFQGIEQLMV